MIAKPPAIIILIPLKIGILQLNSTIGAFMANREKFGAEFILTPELFCVAIVVAFIKQPVSM